MPGGRTHGRCPATAGANLHMAKLTMPAQVAAGLSARERVLLFCAASGTNWQHAGVTGENVTAMVVKGLITRDAAGEIALTDRGRPVFRAMLLD